MLSLVEYEEVLEQRLPYITDAHGYVTSYEVEEDLMEIGESYVAALLQNAGVKQASEIFVAAITGGIVAASHWRMIRENKQTMILYLCEAEVTDEALGIMRATDLESEEARKYLIMVSDLITEAVSMVGEYCKEENAVEYIYTTLLQLYRNGVRIGVFHDQNE